MSANLSHGEPSTIQENTWYGQFEQRKKEYESGQLSHLYQPIYNSLLFLMEWRHTSDSREITNIYVLCDYNLSSTYQTVGGRIQGQGAIALNVLVTAVLLAEFVGRYQDRPPVILWVMAEGYQQRDNEYIEKYFSWECFWNGGDLPQTNSVKVTPIRKTTPVIGFQNCIAYDMRSIASQVLPAPLAVPSKIVETRNSPSPAAYVGIGWGILPTPNILTLMRYVPIMNAFWDPAYGPQINNPTRQMNVLLKDYIQGGPGSDFNWDPQRLIARERQVNQFKETFYHPELADPPQSVPIPGRRFRAWGIAPPTYGGKPLPPPSWLGIPEQNDPKGKGKEGYVGAYEGQYLDYGEPSSSSEAEDARSAYRGQHSEYEESSEESSSFREAEDTPTAGPSRTAGDEEYMGTEHYEPSRRFFNQLGQRQGIPPSTSAR